MAITGYVVRLYIDGFLHSTYRVDTEADAWEKTTELRYKFGNKVSDITITEVLRYGTEETE